MKTYWYIFVNYSKFAFSSSIDLSPSTKDFFNYLKKDPSAFAFFLQK